MKLKVGDQVVVDGEAFYVVKVDPFNQVYTHRQKNPEFGTIFNGPFPKSVYREWPVK